LGWFGLVVNLMSNAGLGSTVVVSGFGSHGTQIATSHVRPFYNVRRRVPRMAEARHPAIMAHGPSIPRVFYPKTAIGLTPQRDYQPQAYVASAKG